MTLPTDRELQITFEKRKALFKIMSVRRWPYIGGNVHIDNAVTPASLVAAH